MTQESNETEVLRRYSSPGLKKNELSRSAKKDHLASAYKCVGEDADKILNQLYGELPQETNNDQPD